MKWKRLVPKHCCEVICQKDGEKHRADILTESGVVVELQHSAISVDEIQERERFYGEKMIWLFDATNSCPLPRPLPANPDEFYSPPHRLILWPPSRAYHDDARLILNLNRLAAIPDDYRRFRWKHPRKSVLFTKRRTYLDTGCFGILRVDKIVINGSCHGYGMLKPASDFTDWLSKRRDL